MKCEEAVALFECCTKRKVEEIKRCGVGIANFVFIITAQSEKYVLRCNVEKGAFEATVRYLKILTDYHIPVPQVLETGTYEPYEYVILTYIDGDDIGNVYHVLYDVEKMQIAKTVIDIQKRVSQIPCNPDEHWNWNDNISKLLNRASDRICRNQYFDTKKVEFVKKLQTELQFYLKTVSPVLYLDDISTKNLLIQEGRVSGIIDIDWLEPGDLLTFVALTRIALMNMDYDTKYTDYLLEEIEPDEMEYKAYIFYCLMYCVDFMGERGMQFLDKVVPVDDEIVNRLNGIFDTIVEEWRQCLST